VVIVVTRLPERRGGVAGGSAASVRSSGARRCRIPAQNGRAKGSLDAQDHGEEGKAREGTQLTGSMPKSKDHSGGYCGAPTINFIGLAAYQTGDGEGKGRGGRGLLIGAGMRRLRQGVKGIEGGEIYAWLSSFRRRRPEVDDGLTRRSHLSEGSTCQWKREREEGVYRFG
jgi:hypothetical protein